MIVTTGRYPTSYLGGATSSGLTTLTLGVYYLITITYDHSATTVTVYINDDAGNATTQTGEAADGDMVIGSHKGLTSQFTDGIVDEIRSSNSIRSVNWTSTEYNNQNAPSTFLVEGTPETPSATTIPIIIHHLQQLRGA